MSFASAEHLAFCVDKTLGLRSARACNLRLVEHAAGSAVCRMDVTEDVAAGTGALSGGELYGLLDSVAYLAVVPMLPDDEAAVSHDAHFSLMSTAPVGAVVEIRSAVQRRGRSLVFIRVEAFVIDGEREKPLALSTVTKSIISMAQRLRHR